jgi:hypothetical protein
LATSGKFCGQLCGDSITTLNFSQLQRQEVVKKYQKYKNFTIVAFFIIMTAINQHELLNQGDRNGYQS